jgi:preprotein translocase SecF subunit
MLEIIGKTNIDFLGKRRWAYLASLLLCAFSVYMWFARSADRYDIDFNGGHEIVIRVTEGADSERVRNAIKKQGVNDAVVQAFEVGRSDEYSIRVGGKADEAKPLKDKITAATKESFAGKGEIIRTDFVGPTAGQELKDKAFWAVVLCLVGIAIYVTVRFEFAFALGALVSLAHDVIVATGIYLWAGHNINMASVAAALTVVGYSVNDTIVIFDKVREEIFKRKDYELIPLMNECVNMMLSRTIITSGLTFFAALALYLFGGGAISDLSLYLTVGVLAGTYSTVFIASPVVFTWEAMRTRKAAKA